ncbi:MAG: prepilin-type N-terminal cleavage/methylation domain-containing protein [Candidatus Moranbacteria bacterium]|nr:prepilin-type N-terminal cleavage/methylation domain-containing protein [Candidatus Moranbacteria bacterium]
MSMIQYQKNKKIRGFSLIEIVVAMAVLGIGFLGVMNLYSGSIVRNASLRDQTTATSLAQEGVELVRGFANDDLGNLSTGNDYKVHITTTNVIELSSALNDRLYYSTSVVGTIGKFSHISSGGVETGFLRKLSIVKANLDDIGIDDDAKVTSMVVWKNTSFPTETNCSLATNCMMAKMDLIAK